MRYVYGPVASRRLGRSLGIDPAPLKTCCFDCIYCQFDRTINKTVERKEYVKADEILLELKQVLEGKSRVMGHRLRDKNVKKTQDARHKTQDARIDYITFSGSGEPTLNSKIGQLIHTIKGMTEVPVAVVTNSALLFKKEVRDELLEADVVLPSLDAVTQDLFEKVNRPHPGLVMEGIIEGIRKLILEFEGKVWLEVMLVKGINDGWKEMVELASVIDRIGPDKVQLNTVVRPPCEEPAKPLTEEELKAIKDILGDRAEVLPVWRRENLMGREGGV